MAENDKMTENDNMADGSAQRGEGAASATDDLTESQWTTLMAWVDGELRDDAKATSEVEALIGRSAVARQIVDDLRGNAAALHAYVLETGTSADLSRVRGRVLTRLPAQPRTPAAADVNRGWMDRLGEALGQPWAIASGLAVAAAVIAVLAVGGLHGEGDGTRGTATASLSGTDATGIAALADDEPAVIIEEMEIESGSIVVQGAEDAEDATIIWHFEPPQMAEDGEGAG